MSKTARIVGIVIGAVVLVAVLLFAGCSALVNQINGGGGSHAEKAEAMMTLADKAPEADWQLLNRYDPKVDNGCLSIDTPCLKLSASWAVNHFVEADEIATRMGLSTEDSTPSAMSGHCTVFGIKQTGGPTEICVSDSKDQPGDYQVDIFMSRR